MDLECNLRLEQIQMMTKLFLLRMSCLSHLCKLTKALQCTEMRTRPSLKERKCIADLLLTVVFFVLQSSNIFIVIVPVKDTVMQIKKVQSDDRFNMKNKP